MDRWIIDIIGNGLRSELKDNKLASQFYTILGNGGLPTSWSKASVSKLLNEGGTTLTEEVQPARSIPEDRRLMHLAVKNLKKYPDRLQGKSDGEEAFFGIPFCIGDRPQSVVYLGSNGSGKTSLFSALEYMGMKKSNTAVIRGFKRAAGDSSDGYSLEKDQDKYLKHSNKEDRNPEIILVRKDSILACADFKKYNAEEKDTLPEAFYCSDYDVRQLEACENYSSFLIDQLGLRGYYGALQYVYFLWGYVNKERGNFEEVKKDNAGKSKEELELLATTELYVLGLTLHRKREAGLLEKLTENLEKTTSKEDYGDDAKIIDMLRTLKGCLEEEQECFREEDWFAFGIWEIYHRNLALIEGVISEIEDKGAYPDDVKSHVLNGELDSLNNLRKQIRDGLQEYFTTQPSENPAIHAKECDERLNKLIKTKSSIEQYKSIETRYIKQAYDDEAFGQFDKECRQLMGYLESGLANHLNEWKTKICDLFKNIISEYFDVDNDDVDINMYLNPLDPRLKNLTEEATLERKVLHDFIQFSIKIKSSGGDYNAKETDKFDADPRSYLNTFKFKLFCVTLKIASCCIAKKMYKVNHPLVIDDVFEASDFDNRVMIRNFAAKLSRQHNELLPEKEYSLQIIFFTQDDLVATQMAKGLRDALGVDNVVSGRIFDYHEVNTTYDKVVISIKDTDKKEYYSVVDTSNPNLPTTSKSKNQHD